MPAGYVTDSDDEADQLDNATDADDTEIPGAIQTANSRVYSTWELYERMNRKTINVAPPYQRDVVWTQNSQSALIDSIFKNKWVPTLLFSERPAQVGPDGKKIKAHWVCIDGKQRLTSIKRFLDGEIPWYKKPKVPIYYRQSHPPHPSRRLLEEPLKELFLGRGLTAAMYSKLDDLQERDIFRLVQEGKPLSTGEKLQASAGPWGSYIGELTTRYMIKNADNPNGWSQRISNLKRGADYHTMAQVVFMINDIPVRAPEPPRSFTTAAIQKELDRLSNTSVPQETKTHVENILNIFMDISTLSPPRTAHTVELRTPDALFLPIQKGRKTMLAPVEMIWIPYMIHLYHSKLSKGKLLEMVEIFKLDIRKRWFNEVKNNGAVIPWILEWIKNFDLGRLQSKYAGWAVPRPPPQLLSQDNPNPTVSGIQEFAKRSLSLQKSDNREETSPASNHTEPVAAPLKRPRLSVEATNTSHLSSTSPRTSSSQQFSLPLRDSSLSQSVTIEPVKRLTSLTSHTSRNASPVLASKRVNFVVNGTQLPSSAPNNGSQPNSRSLPSGGSPTLFHPVYQSGVPRFVSNYPTPSTNSTVNFQRPAQTSALYSTSATQLPYNTNMSYRMSEQVLRQPSGYTRYH